jgi:hypothetical protein
VPIIGHERHVGEPQQPHHHHVQGLHEHMHELEEPVVCSPESGVEEFSHQWDTGLLEHLHFGG